MNFYLLWLYKMIMILPGDVYVDNRLSFPFFFFYLSFYGNYAWKPEMVHRLKELLFHIAKCM